MAKILIHDIVLPDKPLSNRELGRATSFVEIPSFLFIHDAFRLKPNASDVAY